ncbi:MAG TPA: hypothetical protein VJS19_01795 [Candidatus Dormibacteraeota bacterium]|nr:hypothetical protein [Candidatus Dormibacteraeota bacterium]
MSTWPTGRAHVVDMVVMPEPARITRHSCDEVDPLAGVGFAVGLAKPVIGSAVQPAIVKQHKTKTPSQARIESGRS